MLKNRLLLSLALVSLIVTMLHAAAPKGWYLAGSQPTACLTGIEPESSYN